MEWGLAPISGSFPLAPVSMCGKDFRFVLTTRSKASFTQDIPDAAKVYEVLTKPTSLAKAKR